jgi:hypothetical protein
MIRFQKDGIIDAVTDEQAIIAGLQPDIILAQIAEACGGTGQGGSGFSCAAFTDKE